jgi:hypothetical protein
MVDDEWRHLPPDEAAKLRKMFDVCCRACDTVSAAPAVNGRGAEAPGDDLAEARQSIVCAIARSGVTVATM